MICIVEDSIFTRKAWATLLNGQELRLFANPEQARNEIKSFGLTLSDVEAWVLDVDFGSDAENGIAFGRYLRSLNCVEPLYLASNHQLDPHIVAELFPCKVIGKVLKDAADTVLKDLRRIES